MIFLNKIIKFFKTYYPKKDIFALHEPFLDETDVENVKKTINSGYISTIGKDVEKFENEIRKICRSKYVIATNSGTSALHLALLSKKVNETHEVLVQSVSFVATVNSILYLNSNPHFIDLEKNNVNIDFLKLEKHLKKFKKKGNLLYNHITKKYIKGLIVMHTFGYSANIIKAKKICKKYNLFLIEDAAESIGSYYGKKHLGTFGDIGILSFNGNKTISTGSGGAILVNKKSIYKKLLHISKVSKKKHSYEYDFDSLGYNYRMSALNASIGLSQIRKIDKILFYKKKIHNNYKQFFSSDKKFKLIQEERNQTSNHWLNTLIIMSKKFSLRDRSKLLSALNKKKIHARAIWKPLHKLSYLKRFYKMDLKNSENLYKKAFNLPSSPIMTKYEKKNINCN